MIKVTISNNTGRKDIFVDPNTTLRNAFEENDVSYASGVAQLDGVCLAPGDLDKTFADFGVTDHCYLSCLAKMDNA